MFKGSLFQVFVFIFNCLPLHGSSAAQPALALSSGSAASGVPVPLSLSLTSGASQAVGLQWTFSYPSASVKAFSATAGPVLTAAGKTLTCAGSASAYTCLATGLNANGIADGVVANISVTLATGASSAVINAAGAMGVMSDGTSIVVGNTAGTASTQVTVTPTVTGLSCPTTSPAASSTISCTVTLSGAAPAGGVSVTLSSSLAPALSVPASVSIAAGASSAIFTAAAGALTTDQTAVLTARLNTSVQTLTMIVIGNPAVTSLQCGSTSLAAAAATTCTVTISKAAPKTGATVTIAANPSTALVVPALVGVASGVTTATFTATAASVSKDQTAQLSVTLNGTQSINVSVIAPIVPTALQCSATTLTSNLGASCTVTISKAAPAGGTKVAISTGAPASLTVPSSVTVAAGASSGSFTITALALATSLNTSVVAAIGSSTVSFAVSLTPAPAALSQLTCSPLTVTPGKGGGCTVTLTATSSSASSISLKSTNTALVAPASVTIPAGSLSSAFTFTTTSSLSGWAILSATLGAVTKTASFTVVVTRPAGAGTAAAKTPGFGCTPRQLQAGASAVCEVSIDGAGDTEGASFTITSSSLHVKTPPAVQGRPGGNSIRFEVTADDNAVQEDVTIEARSGEASAFTSLGVLPSGAPAISISGPRTVKRGSRARLVATAADGQGLPVKLALGKLPEHASFDETTGVFEWTPASAADSADLTFTAVNSLGASTSKTVTIRANDGQPAIDALQNGAGPDALAACAPGALMSVTGDSLVDASGAARLLVNGSPATLVQASAQRIAFLCPNLDPGTPLTLAVETRGVLSNELRSVMAESAPGLLTLDGSRTGQGVAVHARGLAALPRFGVAGMPAARGEALTLYATGINCGENPPATAPLLYFGHDYVRVTAAKASAIPGVCELRALVPAGVSGDAVPVLLEMVRGDGSVARSNIISVAVE